MASTPTGKYSSVSHFRRLVTDLMHFSAKVPSATLERRMNLAPLVAARQANKPSPTWSAIITKAFAVVAARTPAFRTSYLTFPWPRLYEHFSNIATINVDRQIDNERVVLYTHIDAPEKRSLQEIDAVIREHQQRAPEDILSYRRALRLSRLPWPFRRFAWWAGLNVFGTLRSRYFGTFGVSSVGSQGAGITHLTPLLTTQLHYGMIDSDGGLEMRISFDHRVLDGATIAQGLADLEDVLLSQMVAECLGTTSSPADPIV